MTCPDQRCVRSIRGTRLGQLPFEPVVTRAGVVGLAGLVILAAEDDEVVIRLRLDPQVVIGIRGVPEQRVGHLPFRRAPADDVGGIESQLRLEERRARHPGVAHERVVRGQHDIAAR